MEAWIETVDGEEGRAVAEVPGQPDVLAYGRTPREAERLARRVGRALEPPRRRPWGLYGLGLVLVLICVWTLIGLGMLAAAAAESAGWA